MSYCLLSQDKKLLISGHKVFKSAHDFVILVKMHTYLQTLYFRSFIFQDYQVQDEICTKTFDRSTKTLNESALDYDNVGLNC